MDEFKDHPVYFLHGLLDLTFHCGPHSRRSSMGSSCCTVNVMGSFQSMQKTIFDEAWMFIVLVKVMAEELNKHALIAMPCGGHKASM